MLSLTFILTLSTLKSETATYTGAKMDILIKDVPCYYELGWKNDPPTIIFRIHEEIIEKAEKIPGDARIVKHYQEIFEYDSFSGDLENSFGFNTGLSARDQQGEFIELHGILPEANTIPCTCDDPENCFTCEGTREKKVVNWSNLWLLAVNVNLLLKFLGNQEIETTSNIPQLITVWTAINPNEAFHGSPIGGEFSKKLTNWLKTKPTDTEMLKVSEVMKAAQKHIWRLNEFNMVRAVLLHDYRYLALNCDGNACGIHPTHFAHSTLKKENIGCEFTCHNVDTPIQQLTLLSGLAALHDQAREEME